MRSTMQKHNLFRTLYYCACYNLLNLYGFYNMEMLKKLFYLESIFFNLFIKSLLFLSYGNDKKLLYLILRKKIYFILKASSAIYLWMYERLKEQFETIEPKCIHHFD